MKKLICITVILVTVLALGVAESIVTTKFYEKLNVELIEINNELIEHKEDIKLSAAEDKMRAVMKKWNKTKHRAMLTSNHAVIRNFDEKLVALMSWIECGDYEDSRACAEVAITLSEDLIDERHLLIGNLL